MSKNITSSDEDYAACLRYLKKTDYPWWYQVLLAGVGVFAISTGLAVLAALVHFWKHYNF